MLPLGADITQLFTSFEVARKNLYEVILRINAHDKEGSEQYFVTFKNQLNAISVETERLQRESKLYAIEFQNQTNEKANGTP